MYNYCHGYAFLSYLEYPVLLIQEYLLIFLVLKYKRLLSNNAYAVSGAYFVLILAFGYRILPKFLLAILVVNTRTCILFLIISCNTQTHSICIFFSALLHANWCYQQNHPASWNLTHKRFNNCQSYHMVPISVHQFKWVNIASSLPFAVTNSEFNFLFVSSYLYGLCGFGWYHAIG